MDARTEARDAEADAKRSAQVQTSKVDDRADKAYRVVVDKFEDIDRELKHDAQRLADLEGWVAELEQFIEEELKTHTPRTRRERKAREERLSRIREARRKRPKPKAATKPTADLPPDYDAVQRVELE